MSQQQLAALEARLSSSIAGLIEEQRGSTRVLPRERPRIGIFAPGGTLREVFWPIYAGDRAVADALFEAGADPYHVPTCPILHAVDPLQAIASDDVFSTVFDLVWSRVRAMHGLVLSGGGDLSSSLYRSLPHPRTGPPDFSRDLWERYAALIAWITCKPTRGICRGMQVMTAARGGGLIQDVRELRKGWPQGQPLRAAHQPRGDVSAENMVEHPLIVIATKCRLAEALSGRGQHSPTRVWLSSVYSLHHQVIGYVVGARSEPLQVVGYPAPGLRITAIAPEGMIEAMEDPDPRRLWMAVGFHAEFMARQEWASNLFTYFVLQSQAHAALPVDCLEPYRNEVKAWLRLHDQLLFSASADANQMPFQERTLSQEPLSGTDGKEKQADALQQLAAGPHA